MDENEMKEMNSYLIDKIEEAIIFDDPKLLLKLDLMEE